MFSSEDESDCPSSSAYTRTTNLTSYSRTFHNSQESNCAKPSCCKLHYALHRSLFASLANLGQCSLQVLSVRRNSCSSKEPAHHGWLWDGNVFLKFCVAACSELWQQKLQAIWQTVHHSLSSTWGLPNFSGRSRSEQASIPNSQLVKWSTLQRPGVTRRFCSFCLTAKVAAQKFKKRSIKVFIKFLSGWHKCLPNCSQTFTSVTSVPRCPVVGR